MNLLLRALPMAALITLALGGAPARAQVSAAADTVFAATGTVAAAAEDTVPTLPGIFLPEGMTLEDLLPDVDWTPTSGAETDSLLRSGLGVVIAFEDTFSFDPGTMDTVLVNAPRVTIGEVIEAIGRRMEAEDRAMRDVEYTTLTTVVERDAPTRMGDDYKVTEQADRTSLHPDRGVQNVRLWKRERTVKDGEVVEEEVEDAPETDWEDVQQGMMMAMPFSRGSGNRYNYEITARDLVGNSLIYRIDFKPKSRFEALPSGTVWVDYSHWVIRKVEARMTGVVPFPMFIESLPMFRISRERMGEYWFTTDMQMEVRLRDIPFVDIPRVIEVRVQIRDVKINGLERAADSLVPRRLRHGNLNPDEFWFTQEASEDSLRAYWDGIAQVWDDDLSPALAPVELTEAQVDSLTEAGSRTLAEMALASPWTFELRELRQPGFNRVQGPVVRAGATFRHRGAVRPRLDLDAGYAFSNQRPEFGARLFVPLIRQEGAEDQPRFLGGAKGVLGLNVSGWKGAALFAGDGRRGTRAASSFWYGSDPNQYYETRGADARLTLNLDRTALGDWQLWGGGGLVEERSLEQQTDWNVLGRRLRPDGNLAINELDDRRWSVGATWDLGPLTLDGTYTRHDVDGFGGPEYGGASGPGSGALGRYRLNELAAGARFELLDAMGNEWIVRGRYREFEGQAPRQWRAWMGDWGTLRGYPAGVLNGDRGAWASVDLRLGADILQAVRMPVLKSWGLQPLFFADHAQAWSDGALGAMPDETVTGQLWDVGFGLGRRLDLPFAWGFPYVRAYAARPVGPGTSDEGWRVLIGFER